MHVTVVTPPADYITLAQAKAQLRVDHSEHDAVIAGYVATAIQNLDGPRGYLRRAVGVQVLELTTYGFPVGRGPGRGIALPLPPATLINDIEYIDPDGATVEVDPEVYELTPDGRVQLAYGQAWPSRRSVEDPITIKYTAGFATVPRPIVTAALMHVAAMYEAGDDGAAFPDAAKSLLSGNYRVPRV